MYPLIHDLVIRTICQYLCGNNKTLVNLQCLNKRFYSIRDIFIRQLCLSWNQSMYAIVDKSYGFNKVHSLWISVDYNTREFSDVSQLSLIHTLTLRNFHLIIDVSPLKRVRDLTLQGCNNIIDVSSLSFVHKLSISNCYGICDVSALGTVYDLTLDFCPKINDVSALGTVHNLTIYYCNSIYDISALKNVPNLTISWCDNLDSVQRSTLKKNYN